MERKGRWENLQQMIAIIKEIILKYISDEIGSVLAFIGIKYNIKMEIKLIKFFIIENRRNNDKKLFMTSLFRM